MRAKLLLFFFLPLLLFHAGAPAAAQDHFTVQRVIDGDTFKLTNGERVRLIGVDTPEAKLNDKLKRDAKRTKQDAKTILALGLKSKEFSKKLLEGKRVRLEFDVQPRDRYGRLLAYVYLENGTFVNAKLLKEGFAQLMTVPPNVKHKDLFLKLQHEARENQRGHWRVGKQLA
ncbi:MAG: thermonuclease family protein [Candidatus Omnitrophota bacterium]